MTWPALVGSSLLGSGCLVLRADIRENPGGKNGIMTGNSFVEFYLLHDSLHALMSEYFNIYLIRVSWQPKVRLGLSIKVGQFRCVALLI